MKWRFNADIHSCCINSDSGVGILSKNQLIGKSILSKNLFFEFCKKQDKQIVLVRLPQQQEYGFWDNEIQFSQIRKQYFIELPFLDFANLPLNDNDFIDYSHLSFQGASRFSIYFNELLKNKKSSFKSRIFR